MKRIYNLYRNEHDNSKTVRLMLERCDTMMYIAKTNTVAFMSHEGQIGEAKNVDNMNIAIVAKNLSKRYERVN